MPPISHRRRSHPAAVIFTIYLNQTQPGERRGPIQPQRKANNEFWLLAVVAVLMGVIIRKKMILCAKNASRCGVDFLIPIARPPACAPLAAIGWLLVVLEEGALLAVPELAAVVDIVVGNLKYLCEYSCEALWKFTYKTVPLIKRKRWKFRKRMCPSGLKSTEFRLDRWCYEMTSYPLWPL